MEKGQLVLVDGRPAEFLGWQDDEFVSYRHLGEQTEHWMSARGFSVRASTLKWRS